MVHFEKSSNITKVSEKLCLTCHKPISLLQLQDTSFEYLDRYVTNLYSSRGMEDRLENDDDNGSLLVGFALVPKIIESCTKKIDLVTKK